MPMLSAESTSASLCVFLRDSRKLPMTSILLLSRESVAIYERQNHGVLCTGGVLQSPVFPPRVSIPYRKTPLCLHSRSLNRTSSMLFSTPPTPQMSRHADPSPDLSSSTTVPQSLTSQDFKILSRLRQPKASSFRPFSLPRSSSTSEPYLKSSDSPKTVLLLFLLTTRPPSP